MHLYFYDSVKLLRRDKDIGFFLCQDSIVQSMEL